MSTDQNNANVEETVIPFSTLIERIQTEKGANYQVPRFDPNNGNENARYLFLLEAPGPKAMQTGYVSLNNPDPTARNFLRQMHQAGISAKEIALWNVVPWYLGSHEHKKIRAATAADVQESSTYLHMLINLMPRLECIVLVGAAARNAHVFLSQHTTARILSCHHPSSRVLNSNPLTEQENIAVLKQMQQAT